MGTKTKPPSFQFPIEFGNALFKARADEYAAKLQDVPNALVAERTAAKKSRNFSRSDGIRAQLAAQGIVLEDTKDGVRWKRQ